ncbi:uncharacterized protein VNE69_10065 [Vairimorpha necatrix]|uniref:Uncharacterized protein n=1 Tax=Vairimorpha necatrix TaxID=6039 RepID=A0AAX4JFC9_9MICR
MIKKYILCFLSFSKSTKEDHKESAPNLDTDSSINIENLDMIIINDSMADPLQKSYSLNDISNNTDMELSLFDRSLSFSEFSECPSLYINSNNESEQLYGKLSTDHKYNSKAQDDSKTKIKDCKDAFVDNFNANLIVNENSTLKKMCQDDPINESNDTSSASEHENSNLNEFRNAYIHDTDFYSIVSDDQNPESELTFCKVSLDLWEYQDNSKIESESSHNENFLINKNSTLAEEVHEDPNAKTFKKLKEFEQEKYNTDKSRDSFLYVEDNFLSKFDQLNHNQNVLSDIYTKKSTENLSVDRRAGETGYALNNKNEQHTIKNEFDENLMKKTSEEDQEVSINSSNSNSANDPLLTSEVSIRTEYGFDVDSSSSLSDTTSYSPDAGEFGIVLCTNTNGECPLSENNPVASASKDPINLKRDSGSNAELPSYNKADDDTCEYKPDDLKKIFTNPMFFWGCMAVANSLFLTWKFFKNK